MASASMNIGSLVRLKTKPHVLAIVCWPSRALPETNSWVYLLADDAFHFIRDSDWEHVYVEITH